MKKQNKIIFGLIFVFSFSFAQEKESKDSGSFNLAKSKKASAKQVNTVEGNLDVLQEALNKAKTRANNFTMINCLLIKRDLNEGILEAAQKTKTSITALYHEQKENEARLQSIRLKQLYDNSEDLRRSIPECISDPILLAELGFGSDEVTLETESLEDSLKDFGWLDLPGLETLPPVVPASQFQ